MSVPGLYLTLDKRSRGFDLEMVTKETDMRMPRQVICTSPYFTPWSCNTESYAQVYEMGYPRSIGSSTYRIAVDEAVKR
jgi:hypothetical protein